MANCWWPCCDPDEFVYVCGNPATSGGVTVWVINKSTGGTVDSFVGGQQTHGIAVDSNGNIYIATRTAAGPWRVEKYDADFVLLDSSSNLVAATSAFGALALDASGNVAVTGGDQVYLFDSTLTQVWTNEWEDFASIAARSAAINTSGAALFSGEQGGGSGAAEGMYTVRVWDSSNTNTLNITEEETESRADQIAVDSSGNIFIALREADTLGNFWLRVRKYNSSGTLQWTHTKTATSSLEDTYLGLAIASSGNIYAGGNTFDGVDGVSDGFILKLDSSGNELNQISLASSVGSTNIRAMAVDGNEDIFLIHQDGLATPNRYDVAKYNSSLVKQWGGGAFPLLTDIDCDPGRVPHFQ